MKIVYNQNIIYLFFARNLYKLDNLYWNYSKIDEYILIDIQNKMLNKNFYKNIFDIQRLFQKDSIYQIYNNLNNQFVNYIININLLANYILNQFIIK